MVPQFASKANTQVTFSASLNPLPSTSSIVRPNPIPFNPLFPSSRASVVGKEVSATSSLSQVPVLPNPSQRKFPGFKKTGGRTTRRHYEDAQ